MRLWILTSAMAIAVASPAFAQQTFVSGFVDQSWMVNPGNRGDGLIDHGTLAGVSSTWWVNRTVGLELTLSAKDVRPRNLGAGPFYQGRTVSWVGFHVNFFVPARESGAFRRVQPYVSLGGGVLRGENRYTFGPLKDMVMVDRENGFPIVGGVGVLVFVTPRIAVRGEVRMHRAPRKESCGR